MSRGTKETNEQYEQRKARMREYSRKYRADPINKRYIAAKAAQKREDDRIEARYGEDCGYDWYMDPDSRLDYTFYTAEGNEDDPSGYGGAVEDGVINYDVLYYVEPEQELNFNEVY